MSRLPQRATEYNHIPIFIETDGDTVYDEVTAIGLLVSPDETHIWSTDTNGVASVDANTHTTGDESQMLSDFASFVADEINVNETILVGYDHEGWRDGVFKRLRTRCVKNEIDWPLDGVYYTDFGEAISGKGRFNTSVPSMSGAYVSTLDAFIDYYDLDVDKSLNKTPKQEAIEGTGYTIEMVKEFANETDEDVPHASLSELAEVHNLLVGEIDTLSDTPIGRTYANLQRTNGLLQVASDFTSRDDWNTRKL